MHFAEFSFFNHRGWQKTRGDRARQRRYFLAGRGFIGLASMIFGKWTPLGTAGAGLLFGFGEALKPYLPKVLPSQFIDMIPYVLTIIVLTSAIDRATPLASIGIPYVKE